MRKATAIVFLVLLATVLTPKIADAQPGSGTAEITPSANVPVGTKSTWAITYSATEPFDSGTVEVIVPGGWTAPQRTDSLAEGFVLVSTTGSGTVDFSVAGQTITVHVDTLSIGEEIEVVYGYAGGGINPTARARTPTYPGTALFIVSSDPSGSSTDSILVSPALDVVPEQPDRLEITPNPATVEAGVLEPYSVKVVDIYGNGSPVAQNRTIALFPPSGSFEVGGVPKDTIQIALGDSLRSVGYRGEAALGGTIFMYTDDGLDPDLFGVAGVTVTPTVPDADASSVVATTPVTADGIDASDVTVTVVDAFDNPVQGVSVEIGAIGADVPAPSTTTGINGVATGIVTSTIAGTARVYATAGGEVLSDTALVTFVAGGVDADLSSIVASPDSVVADGRSFSTITVTARDEYGNPVPDKTVALYVTPDSIVVLNPTYGSTGSDGTMTATILSTRAIDYQVDADVDGVPVAVSATVSFRPGPVWSFTWTVPDSGTAGSWNGVTLTAYDAQRNRKIDYTGTVSLTTNALGNISWAAGVAALGTLNPGDPPSYTFDPGDAGSAPLLLTNDRMETFRLTAIDGDAVGISSDIGIDHAGATSIDVVAGTAQTATVFNDVPISPKVRVTDAYGNPVDNEPVEFQLIDAQIDGSIDVDTGSGGPDDSVGVTDTMGELDCDRWTLGKRVGTNKLQAIIGEGIDSEDFFAYGTPGPGDSIDIQPVDRHDVNATASFDVTAKLTDAYGNPVPGAAVTIFIKTPAEGTLSQSTGHTTTQISPTARSGITDAAGETSVSYDAPSTAGGSDFVDASSLPNVPDINVTDREYTTITTGAVKLRLSFVGGSTVRADSVFKMLVQAIDDFDNVDSSRTDTIIITRDEFSGLEFSLTSDFGDTITQFDLSSGQETVYGRSKTAGSWDITVDDADGLALDRQPITIIDAGAIDHYYVSPAVRSVKAGQNFWLTIEARDAFDNVVASAGTTVDLEAVDPADGVTVLDPLQVPQATLVGGRVTIGQQYTTAEDIFIRASDGTYEGLSDSVSVGPALADHIRNVSGDTAGVEVGTPVTLVAEVLDRFENPVPGEAVDFDRIEGTGEPSPTSAASGADGRATVDFQTGSLVGDNRVRASILGGANEQERTEYLISTVAGSVDTFLVAFDKTRMVAGETVSIEIRALDQNKNLVSHDSSTVIEILPDTGNPILSHTSGTLVGGVFDIATVTDTHAGSFSLRVQDQDDPSTVYGFSPTVTVSSADPFEVVKFSGDSTITVAGQPQPLVAEVRDQYGNPVPDRYVTFALNPAGNPGGTANLGGGPGPSYVLSDSLGQATETLNTATKVGENLVDVTILAGPPPGQIKTETFSVTTVAGSIAEYDVVLGETSETAGVPIDLIVSAIDSMGNLVVNDNSTVIALSLASGSDAVFDTNFVSLAAGTLLTTVTDTLAESFQVRAETQGTPGVFGLGPLVTIAPDVPAGDIPATASPDTITANGTSTTTITSDVITDQYGNQVQEDELITVTTTLGTITSVDQYTPTPEVDRAVGPDGKIEFKLRSSTTPGTATVRMNSRSGPARDSTTVTFAQPPLIVATDGLIPNTVITDSSYAFRVPIENQSTTPVDLSIDSWLKFDDGVTFFEARLASQQRIIGPDTLVFMSTLIDSAMTPTYYRPTLELDGRDVYDSEYAATISLPTKSLLVSAIQITEITGPPQVAQGDTVEVQVEVYNPTTWTVTIKSATLSFNSGLIQYVQFKSPSLPLDIPADQRRIVSIPVSAVTGTGVDSVDASVAGTVNGAIVTDNSVEPFQRWGWTVQESSNIEYVAKSLVPSAVSRGKQYAIAVELENTGQATATIYKTITTLSFSNGSRRYETHPSQNFSLSEGERKVVVFEPNYVPPDMPLGLYDVTIDVGGEANGQPLYKAISTAAKGDTMEVQSPAALVQNDPLGPSLTVSQGKLVFFTVSVRNDSTATVLLNPESTRIRFEGGAYNAPLALTSDKELETGISTLQFQSVIVVDPLNEYSVVIDLKGSENGLGFEQSLSLSETVTVQSAPRLSVNIKKPSPGTVTAKQTQPWNIFMVLENNGDSPVELDLDSLATNLFFDHVTAGDVTSGYTVKLPIGLEGGGTTLPGGGGVDSLLFVIERTDTTLGGVNVEGIVAGRDVATLDSLSDDTRFSGGGGYVVVESPAELSVVSIRSHNTQVTEGQTAPWFVTAVLRNSGGETLDMDISDASLTFGGGSGWEFNPPPAFEWSHDSLLRGFSTDSLVFAVTKTGGPGNPVPIELSISGVSINRDTLFTAGSGVVGDSIWVQSRAQLAVDTVYVIAPNGNTVNHRQSFDAAVAVHNGGEAPATAYYSVRSRNGSDTPPPGQIGPINGNSTVFETFSVAAADSPATIDWIVVVIDSAQDINSGQTDTLVVLAEPRDSVEVVIQEPAFLRIDSIVPSKRFVTRQQTITWTDTVFVSNKGGADLKLVPPTDSNLKFFFEGIEQTDYDITAPVALESGGTDWVVADSTSDALVYQVNVTGSRTGDITNRIVLSAKDMNDTKAVLADTSSTVVTVQGPTGPFIMSTRSKAKNIHEITGVSYVNTRQMFDIVVRVPNSGEDVEEVGVWVSIWSMNPATIFAPVDSVQSIAEGDTATYTFSVRAHSLPIVAQTFTARVDSAWSVNTGQPVTPNESQDNTEAVVVQTPADLAIESFTFSSPPSASNGNLSTGQPFEVTARVANLGQAEIAGSGEVTLLLPPGFAFQTTPDDSVRTFDLGTDRDRSFKWQIVAPGDSVTADLSCVITKIPYDKNLGVGEPAHVSVTGDTITAYVEPAGKFRFDMVEISNPVGARDGEVSSGQEFWIRMEAFAEASVTDKVATLNLPPGLNFRTIGGATRTFGDFVTNLVDSFHVEAPDTVAVSGSIVGDFDITLTGIDQNTDSLVTQTSDPPIIVTAVERTRLELAPIVPSSEAADGTVKINSTFALRDSVWNRGTAGIDPTTYLTVSLTPPAGYTVDNRTPLDQTVDVGQAASWTITAPPQQSTGADVFKVEIIQTPDDENTNLPAEVTVSERTIPIVTEGATVEMADKTVDEGIDNKVVPGGSRNVDQYAFSLKYNVANDPSANDARIYNVGITILGANNRALADGALRSTITRIYIRINGDIREAANPQTNPVVVDLSTSSAAVIEPDSTVTLIVGVDVAGSPPVQEIRLLFDGPSSIDVQDAVTGQTLGVVNAIDGGPIDNDFKSRPLVILSDRFEEYVHNFPNPFRAGEDKTKITYYLDRPGNVEIKIYSLTGRLVYEERTSVSGIPTGRKTALEAEWDGKNMKGEVVRNGIYICVINAGSNSARFRIAVAK